MADPAIVIGSFAEMFDTFAKQQAKFQSSIESLLKQNNAILEKNNQTFEYMNEAQERYLAGRPTNVQAPREVKEKENKVLIDGYTRKGKDEYKKLNVEPESEATKPEEQKEGGILSTIFKFIGAGALGIAGVMGLKKLLSEETIDRLKSFYQELTDKTNIRFLTSRLKKGFNEFLDKTVNGLFFGMKLALSALVENFQDYLPDFMKDAAYNILYEDESFSDVGERIKNYIANLPIVKYFTNLYKAGANLFGSEVYEKEALFQFLEALGFSREFGENIDGIFNFALDTLEFAGVERAGELEGFAGFKTLVAESLEKGLKNLGNYLSTFLTNILEDVRAYFESVADFYRIKYAPLNNLDIGKDKTSLLKMFFEDEDTEYDERKQIAAELLKRSLDGDETAKRMIESAAESNVYDLNVLEKMKNVSPEEIATLRRTAEGQDPLFIQNELMEMKRRGEEDPNEMFPFQDDLKKRIEAIESGEIDLGILNYTGIGQAAKFLKDYIIDPEERKSMAEELKKTLEESFIKKPTPETGNEDNSKNQSFFNVSPSQTINNDFSSTPTMEFFRQTALA